LSYSGKNIDEYILRRVELVDYATAIVGDRSRGEDVVQEAFIRLRAATADERVLEEPAGYLRRIVRNLALDWIRRIASERRHVDDAALAETVAQESPSPEDIVAGREELRIVMEALAELPERTRIALEMHRFDGCKLREIAERLGISVALAHKLVYDGLAHCRARLAARPARRSSTSF
jgi:RNA polymerase sigma factor, sigma-70 family